MDEVTLECEPADSAADRGALANQLEQVLKESTGVRIVVAVLDPGTVPRSEGKAVRVVDRRS
jgi:phenylacetate-CoA ligase